LRPTPKQANESELKIHMESYLAEVDNIGLKWRNMCWDCNGIFQAYIKEVGLMVYAGPMQPKNFKVNFFLYFVLNFLGRPSWKELLWVCCGPLCSQNYYHSNYKVLMVYPLVHFRLIPMFVAYWVLIQSSISFSNLSIGCWIFYNWLNW